MTDPFVQAGSDYLSPANSTFVEELYHVWQKNPSAVDASWQQYFSSLGDSPDIAEHSMLGASWAPRSTAVIGVDEEKEVPRGKPESKVTAQEKDIAHAIAHDSVRALMMIHAYRVRGHLIADIDPLKQEPNKHHPELDPATYGFTADTMNKEVFLDGVLGLQKATVGEIISILHNTYCSTMGVEFMHIQYPEQKAWIQRKIESARGRPEISTEDKKNILSHLIEVEAFEEFVQVKYVGMKRFSVQGGDAAIAGVEVAIRTAAGLGVEEVLIGMPHRGRMNIITSIMHMPYLELLSVFHGNLDFPEWVDSSGDVKYHLGASTDREIAGKNVHLSLSANPSHLEAVNPVVVGKARAKLQQKGDIEEKDKVMSILMHGDAAFAGQGLVPETLSMAELKGYRTGGTVHIIVNNQIGFTTNPKNSRFTPYPSDAAKMVQAPIFHVNGDDPEAVAYACRAAVEFRQEFKRDVVIDVTCYRKYGHNEGDEPMFTQPLMYKAIKKHPSPATIYSQKLIKDSVVSSDEVKGMFQSFRERFDKDFETAKTFTPNKADWLEGAWSGLEKPKGEHPAGDTGADVNVLKQVGEVITSYPEDFNINRKLARIIDAKKEMFASGKGFDWATAEALAFGTLVKEGTHVRLSGQDCERGTFSQRHAVMVDQENENRYTPLRHVSADQGRFTVINSNLSEMGILGFEYGYSLAEPQCLTMWEAQFGDFANGAQVIIDQFVASGEIKWLRMSGLVMLLPHGFEGQGPEHSSARLERYLQLCGEDNMQVVNATTPANYFHVLRRQIHRNFRKPLIIMTPKSLLRHRRCVSTLEDMAVGTHFQRVIPETEKLVADKDIKRVVFTSGKVYYELLEEREERKVKDIAIVRTEQYYPFPIREVKEQLERYSNAEVMWCQEEPENMGAWRFIGPRIGDVLEQLGREQVKIKYAGRKEAASPATGYLSIHLRQQKELVDAALTMGNAKSGKKGKAA